MRDEQRALLILKLRIILLQLALLRLRPLQLDKDLALLVGRADDGKRAPEHDDQQKDIEAAHGAIRSATRITADWARGLRGDFSPLANTRPTMRSGGLGRSTARIGSRRSTRGRAGVRLHEPLDDPILERMKADHDQPPLAPATPMLLQVLPAAPQP